MKPRIYIETSVISYLTSRPSRDFTSVTRQEFTRQWWDLCHSAFDPVISTLVMREVSRGDANAAKKRIEACAGLECLRVTDEAIELAQRLMREGLVPLTEPEDATHIALASTEKLDYIATWNFTHMVGPQQKFKLQLRLNEWGCHVPLLATPEDLLEIL